MPSFSGPLLIAALATIPVERIPDARMPDEDSRSDAVPAAASTVDSIRINQYVSFDPAKKAVYLTIIGGHEGANGGMNFNGADRGGARIAGEEGHLADHAAGAQLRHLGLPVEGVADGDGDGPLHDAEHRRAEIALPHDDRAGREGNRRALLGEGVELVRTQHVREAVDRLQRLTNIREIIAQHRPCESPSARLASR